MTPDAVFDTLIEGDSVSFKPVPEPKTPGSKPKVVDYARQLGLPISVELPEPGTALVVRGNSLGQVQTLHYPNDLEAILRRISYAARTAIEESGMKMLHLIFGFLEWFESDASDQSHLAPLLLVPVTIEKGKADKSSGTFTYGIAYSEADQIEENLSLREKLKHDFGLDMPELLDGEAPESYFLKFRGMLSAKPRWKLRRRVTLGLVSFGKLLMFRDLDPKKWPKPSDLLEHPRIKDFFEGTKHSEALFADEYQLDALDQQDRVPPLIHDADSSQHSALIDALDGRNLVIEGPPGTGKSQTITNLIALAVSNEKTVLFVSEKLAALEVVRRRLDQAGLGLFCLELHSHKTDKRKLLDELEERLEASQSLKPPKDLNEKKTLLRRHREQLVEYVELINKPFSALGHTAFDVIWRRERLRQELSFDPSLVEKIVINRDQTTQLADFELDCELLDVYGRHLTELRKHFPDLQKHPWRQVSNASLDYPGERRLIRNLEQVASTVRDMQAELRYLASVTDCDTHALASREALSRWVENFEQIPNPQEKSTKAVLSATANPDREKELRAFISDVHSWTRSRAELAQRFPAVAESRDPGMVEPLRSACEKAMGLGLRNFSRTVLTGLATECAWLRSILKPTAILSRASLVAQLETCESGTALSRLFGRAYRQTQRTFTDTFVSRKRPRRREMVEALRRAIALLKTLESDEEFSSCHKGRLLYEDLGLLVDSARSLDSCFEYFKITDGQNARGVLALIYEFSHNCMAATKIASDPVQELIGTDFHGVDTNLQVITDGLDAADAIRKVDILEPIRSWLLQSDTDQHLSILIDAVAKISKQLHSLTDALVRFSELGQVNAWEWWGPKPLTFATLERIAEAALKNQSSLSGWLEFTRASKSVDSGGLGEIAMLTGASVISTSDLVPAYTYAFYNTLVQRLTGDRPQLLQFSGLTLDAAREKFAYYDKQVIELNRQAAASASRRVVPHGVQSGPVGQLTELGLIRQEIGKKKRHIPIRQLVKRAGQALQALKPCFMMGPLSVAQYIEPGRLTFDLVVMDEASQLKPEDALGAVARGGQLVVVGDPKQLPPSTFFERQFDLDQDEEEADGASSIEEHESILDVARSVYQPVRQLRWHYRSRHDSLIAFSNAEFYQNRLLVFPSPSTKRGQDGVQFRYVADGVYESGHARWNRPEAERVVASIVNHMHNASDLSLGVVALNFQQRELIEDLLTERIRNDDVAQSFLDYQSEASEPFFVKNLENVQGDERDVILISATYGRDQNGNFFQRFGPINQAQGPRRLNVLFTRAKHRVVVFSSIDPDDIQTEAASPRGVVVLKSYLNYAKSGRLEYETYSEHLPASDFEVAVANSLVARGFQCVPQIGVAGFFIDVGIRHPLKPGTFILGIECDGASYHSAKSARDRDRLRQTILENLGWNIHRIWSTDWFKDSRHEVEKVLDRLQMLLTGSEQGNGPKLPSVSISTGGGKRSAVDNSPGAPSRQSHTEDEQLSDEEARETLIRLREDVIKKSFPNIDPSKGLLRKSLLDTFLRLKPTSREEWLARIPYDLRSATDPEQVGKYLDEVLEIVSRIS